MDTENQLWDLSTWQILVSVDSPRTSPLQILRNDCTQIFECAERA